MASHTPDLGNERLLQLAAILQVADEVHVHRREPTYDQQKYTHACGTPACALGHWAAANPESWVFECGVPVGRTNGSRWNQAAIDFHLSSQEYEELFGPFGCGLPKTAKSAASYIREFVARRQAVRS